MAKRKKTDVNNGSQSRILHRKLPLSVPGPSLLAYGAERNSGFCLTRNSEALLFILGDDLAGQTGRMQLCREIETHRARLGLSPRYAVHDLHPDYASTRFAVQSGLISVGVQHHHAHMASVMAEHQLAGPAIGVVFDGMGLGENGELWGGEFLLGEFRRFRRVGHLLPVAQPGGDAAAFEPWRMALSYLRLTFGEDWPEAAKHIIERQGMERCKLILRAADQKINSPITTSAGRLFEAVSSIMGLCDVNTAPAAAAIALEKCADETIAPPLPFKIAKNGDVWVADPSQAIREIVKAKKNGESDSSIAAGFHYGMMEMTAAVCEQIREENGIGQVVLSGGVFQNNLLRQGCRDLMKSSGFKVFLPERVPPHDGGLSYGQAAVAGARLDL